MSYGETITRTDLTNILNEVLPLRSDTTCTEVTLPFTPQENGLLFVLIRAVNQGRFYVAYSNATPGLVDAYQVAGGYTTAVSFVEKGKQVAQTDSSNLQQKFFYFVPLDGYGIAGSGSKTLLWTNPNPTSAMSSQQLIASGADSYDEIQVVYKTAHVYDGWQTQSAPFVSGGHITLLAPSGLNGEFSGTIVNAVRTITMSSGGKLTADNAGVFTTSGFSTNNNMCIPVYIYGIKH